MKKMMLLAAALLVSLAGKTQCPAKVVYYASKLEMLDSLLNVMDSKDVNASFQTSPSGIYAKKSENDGDTLSGTVKKADCNWSEPFKNGKTVIISDIDDGHENLQNVTVTIEAKDGKITIMLHANEYPNQLIRLNVDKYEEKP